MSAADEVELMRQVRADGFKAGWEMCLMAQRGKTRFQELMDAAQLTRERQARAVLEGALKCFQLTPEYREILRSTRTEDILWSVKHFDNARQALAAAKAILEGK